MSNHRQITDRGPSPVSIALDLAVSIAAMAGFTWIAAGPEIGSGQMVGSMTSIVLGAVMLGSAATKISERSHKLRRAERDRVRRLAGPESYESWMASTGPLPGPMMERPSRLLTPEEEGELQKSLREARSLWTEPITEVLEIPRN